MESAQLAPPEPESVAGIIDPYNLGPAVIRLSANSRRAGQVAIGILTAVLEPGERVESLVQGRYQNHDGVVAFTNRRVVIVNDHDWLPDLRKIEVTSDLVVQGWQDDRTASLVFVTDVQSITISEITDRPLAQEMAQLIRARAANNG